MHTYQKCLQKYPRIRTNANNFLSNETSVSRWMSADDIIRLHFERLDEDILEYVLSLAGGDDCGLVHDEESVAEQVSMFLVSAMYCEQDEAEISVKELASKLRALVGADMVETVDSLKKLEKPLEFASMDVVDDYGPRSSLLANVNETYEGSDAKLTKSEIKRAERKHRKQKEEDAKLASSDNSAMQLSSLQIAAVGGEEGVPVNIVLSSFDLPNKKGSGPDLLTNANITFTQGRRYGLVGLNGCGKSTLLEAMNDRSLEGMKWHKQSILLVKQEVEGNVFTPLEWVLASSPRPTSIKAQIENLSNRDDPPLDEIARLHDELGIIESTKGEQQAGSILFGLGFDKKMQNRPTSTLSGGWRRRVAIACALFVNPQILLLDEPTNHLDLETVLWLEAYLTSDKFDSTLLVVSHDRNFLNSVVTDIVSFSNSQLTSYRGDYVSYLDTMEQNKVTRMNQRQAQEMKRAHLQEYITKHAKAKENGPKAAAQRKSRMKKLDRLGVEAAAANKGGKYKASEDGGAEEIEDEIDENEFELAFPVPTDVQGTIIQLDEVTFAYDGCSKLLDGVTVNFDTKSRVAILGRNGSGKSTLLKLFLGLLTPSSGSLVVKQHCKIEYIAQHHSEKLDLESTPLDIMLERYPGDHSMNDYNNMRRYLAQFGLSGSTLPLQLVKTLSGGQKFRIALALAMFSCPNMIIMDEPSNHLDTETLNALINAISAFKGGIVVVSHDEHLLEKACNELYVVRDGVLERFHGGFAKYKKHVLKNKKG